MIWLGYEVFDKGLNRQCVQLGDAWAEGVGDRLGRPQLGGASVVPANRLWLNFLFFHFSQTILSLFATYSPILLLLAIV